MSEPNWQAIAQIWREIATSEQPPGDMEADYLRVWARDCDAEDVWRAVRAAYLAGKEDA